MNKLASSLIFLVASFPLLTGAKQCGADAANPAPDVTGEWALTYADDLEVEITLGGSVYTETIGLQGGSITIDHEGQPFTFELDCSRPEVVCPSEVWAEQVSLNQKQTQYPRRVWVEIPLEECDGMLIQPEPSECGPDTPNLECEQVCSGETASTSVETFGMMDPDGEKLDVFLGAGVASNGLNCLALGISAASTIVEADGSAAEDSWVGHTLAGGKITTAYAGGCLWAGDPDDDGSLEAIVIGASIKLSTSFKGARIEE